MKKGFRFRKPFTVLCDRDRIQTYNLLIRSQMLYSIELRSQTDGKYKAKSALGGKSPLKQFNRKDAK